MIRPLSRLLVCSLALALNGCSVAIPVSGGALNALNGIFLMPILMDDGGGRMKSGGGYSDVGWFANPDSHPAVVPKAGNTGPADGTQVQPR
ncbi:MAG: hypothetical protein JWN73_4231 [Betaproteobacteria bacterium]|nr:hypothetical protein [Betaproteobacteria bacterium]